MKRKVITDPTILRQKSNPISDKDEIENTIKDLEDSLNTKLGIGLSAIQIGIPLQIGIIRISGKEPINLINPKILEKSDKFRHIKEGCLSLPGIRVDTLRYKDITLESNGEIYSAYGLEAVAIQHEIDHMKGLTILDKKWKRRR